MKNKAQLGNSRRSSEEMQPNQNAGAPLILRPVQSGRERAAQSSGVCERQDGGGEHGDWQTAFPCFKAGTKGNFILAISPRTVPDIQAPDQYLMK